MKPCHVHPTHIGLCKLHGKIANMAPANKVWCALFAKTGCFFATERILVRSNVRAEGLKELVQAVGHLAVPAD
jgi:hypothetical protein